AFCAGLISSRIYVSTGALAALDGDELQAVVTHERHHARQRDPLRIFVARVLADAMFFLPAARRLGERYASLAELAADGAAVRAAGNAAPLASALLSFQAANPAVAGIAPERVDHLMGERSAWELPVVLLAWSSIALAAVAAVALRVSATASPDVNVPLLFAQSCMLAMAVAPLAIGGFLLARTRVRSARSDAHTTMA
ncbi:MAG TPA: M56 family metallopeptidase, partial [Solirubrobacteraceae bacterium]|nr:M56 family metallopeptidase [Solirubrobacteraceae bacterium]